MIDETKGIDIAKMRDGRVNVVVSVSGGKDSAAAALHLRDLGIPARYVFADTGWEALSTYHYIDEVLEPALGKIERVRTDVEVPPERMADVERIEAILGVSPSPMVRLCLRKSMFPSRKIRWCTSDLKVAPLRKHHQRIMEETGRIVVSVNGVRADESAKRAGLGEWEVGEAIDAAVWRPLIRWTTEDVIAIHHRHGLRPNPLYLAGMGRVGCFPCISAGKAEYAAVGRDDRRVAAMRELERIVGDNAVAEGRVGEGRKRPTWYWGRPDDENAPIGNMPGIDTVVEWARTDRGGRQFAMFDDGDRGGCLRWGLCEARKP